MPLEWKDSAVSSPPPACCLHRALCVLKAGAAFLLLEPSYPPKRLVGYLRRTEINGFLYLEAAGPLPKALEAFVASAASRFPRLRRWAPIQSRRPA